MHIDKKILTVSAIILAISAASISYLELTEHTTDDSAVDLEKDKNDTVEWVSGEPELEVRVTKDRVAGFNVKVDVENFTFEPEYVNQHHREQEGHGHVYVNGEQIRRFYNPKTHFYVPEGNHNVTVVLASHDHRLYSYDGRIVKSNHEILKEEEHNLELYQ